MKNTPAGTDVFFVLHFLAYFIIKCIISFIF